MGVCVNKYWCVRNILYLICKREISLFKIHLTIYLYIVQVLSTLGEPVDREDLAELIKTAQVDTEGKIFYYDFIRKMIAGWEFCSKWLTYENMIIIPGYYWWFSRLSMIRHVIKQYDTKTNYHWLRL